MRRQVLIPGKCITKVKLNVENREHSFFWLFFFFLMAFYGSKAKKKSGLSLLVGQGEFTVYLTYQIDMQGAKKRKDVRD